MREKLTSQGRLQCLAYSQGKEDVMIMNVYAPSGHRDTEERAQLSDVILHEMATHGTDQWVIAGDLNESPLSSKLLAHLCTARGWRIPALLDTDITMPCYL